MVWSYGKLYSISAADISIDKLPPLIDMGIDKLCNKLGVCLGIDKLVHINSRYGHWYTIISEVDTGDG